MGKDLAKLAQEIDNLVNGFVSKAQFPAAPMGKKQDDSSNDLPRMAARRFLKGKVTEGTDKWNAMLDKAPDADYETLKGSTKIDLRMAFSLSGGKYKVAIKPEIEPSRNPYGEKMLQPYFNGLAGLVGVVATKSIRNATGNSSFGLTDTFMNFT